MSLCFIISFFHKKKKKKISFRGSLLIKTKQYVEFLVGSEGEFDILAASVVKRVKKQMDYGNCSLVFVLPYMKAEFRDNEKDFLDYYDDVEICERSANAHFKSAMQIRNRAMVDKSDFVICCIQHKSGGAYKTVRYSLKRGINIYYLEL